MKLFCDAIRFDCEIELFDGAVPPTWGAGEISVFLAKATAQFPHDATWELESEGKRTELAIRADSGSIYTPPVGIYAALFTAPALG